MKLRFWTFRWKSMIELQNLQTNFFDKIDAFPFYINSMPYLDSNMLSKIFYASVGSEILRIARTTTDLIRMVICPNLLLIRMKEQK